MRQRHAPARQPARRKHAERQAREARDQQPLHAVPRPAQPLQRQLAPQEPGDKARAQGRARARPARGFKQIRHHQQSTDRSCKLCSRTPFRRHDAGRRQLPPHTQPEKARQQEAARAEHAQQYERVITQQLRQQVQFGRQFPTPAREEERGAREAANERQPHQHKGRRRQVALRPATALEQGKPQHQLRRKQTVAHRDRAGELGTRLSDEQCEQRKHLAGRERRDFQQARQRGAEKAEDEAAEEALHHQPRVRRAGIVARPAQQQGHPQRDAEQPGEGRGREEQAERLAVQVGEGELLAGRHGGLTLPQMARATQRRRGRVAGDRGGHDAASLAPMPSAAHRVLSHLRSALPLSAGSAARR